MKIKVGEERRIELVLETQHFFRTELDRELSDFQARAIVDFFIEELGPPIYNQAIQDSLAFLQEKLSDLEGELYLIEDRNPEP